MADDTPWDPKEAAGNFRKHGVRMSDELPVLDDPNGITISDNESAPAEERFVTLGTGALRHLLVVVYTYDEDDNPRLISVRKALPHEREQYADQGI